MGVNQQLLDQVLHGTNIMPSEQEPNLGNIEDIMAAIQKLIELCGDDPHRDGLQETPMRVLRAFLEYTQGYREDPKSHLLKTFTVDVHHQELVMVKDIEFFSLCEHHFAPFFGAAHVGYIPNQRITGLSKIARMVEGYAKRFQVQERLTDQIVEAMQEVLNPKGAIVIIEAQHLCMSSRGIKKAKALTTTSAARGVFATDADAQARFMALLNR